mmetsp:Transcript_32123/g.102185  ORF Transcript_32123/g.102185 Transcript_32123/m.102185 type:complete len:306 (-) Transcript_32123:239-1156(-)
MGLTRRLLRALCVLLLAVSVRPEALLTEQRRGVLKHAIKKAIGGGVPGAVAGAVQVSTLMWMRTTLNYQYRYGVSFFEAARRLYGKGGLLRFYKGIEFALLQGPLSRFGATAANDGIMALLADSDASLSLKTGCGAFLAAAWRVTIMPVDTCKTVLQVHGREGFEVLGARVRSGDLRALYQGSLAVWMIALTSHFPWFFVHNVLDAAMVLPPPGARRMARNALIGFASSITSDICSNSARVLKIMKQSATADDDMTYTAAIKEILKHGGILHLFGRGLLTRMCVNAVQSIVFTVVWKYMTQRHIK